MKRLIEILCVFGLFIFPCFSQSIRPLTPEHVAVKGKLALVSVSNLFGELVVGCAESGKKYRGVIVKRNFKSDEITPNGFVLRLIDDERLYINLDLEYLNEFNRGLSIRDQISVADLIKMGMAVEVMTIVCGSGNIEFADKIKILGGLSK